MTIHEKAKPKNSSGKNRNQVWIDGTKKILLDFVHQSYKILTMLNVSKFL